jgi:hypothetical protein
VKNEGVGCSELASMRGKCFFNGNTSLDYSSSQRPCSDVVDIVTCDQLKNPELCSLADRNTFPNFGWDISNSSPCIWDINFNTCVVVQNQNVNSDKDISITTVIIIIVVFTVVVVILVVIIIVFVFRGRKKDEFLVFQDKTEMEMETSKLSPPAPPVTENEDEKAKSEL